MPQRVTWGPLSSLHLGRLQFWPITYLPITSLRQGVQAH